MAFLPHDDCQRQRSHSTLHAVGRLAASRRTTSSVEVLGMSERAHVRLGEQEVACEVLSQAHRALFASDILCDILRLFAQ
jgi:hypothetical protein